MVDGCMWIGRHRIVAGNLTLALEYPPAFWLAVGYDGDGIGNVDLGFDTFGMQFSNYTHPRIVPFECANDRLIYIYGIGRVFLNYNLDGIRFC